MIGETEAKLETLGERQAIYRAEEWPRPGCGRAMPAGAGAQVASALARETGRAVLAPRLAEPWKSCSRGQTEALEIEPGATREGVSPGGGHKDTPVSGQGRMVLLTERAAQTAAPTPAEARAAALARRHDAELLRINRAAAEMPAPADVIYRERLSVEGVEVRRGDPVSHVVDCGSIAVTASVREAFHNRMSVGETAVFRPGAGSRSVAGPVDRMAGQARPGSMQSSPARQAGSTLNALT